MASGFALFDTAIGRCGVAWGERGVAGVQLPEVGRAGNAGPHASTISRRRGSASTARGAARHRPHRGAVARRDERSFDHRARHGPSAGLPPSRLRGRPRHSAGHDLVLWRDRRPGRGTGGRARRRAGARAKSVPDRRAVPSRARRRRQDRRLFSARRHRHQAPHAGDRRRAAERCGDTAPRRRRCARL